MEVIKGRMYDYNNGRFLSVDPFIQNPANTQSLNPYTYIFNNPLSGVDPSGYATIFDRKKDCADISESACNKKVSDLLGPRKAKANGNDKSGTVKAFIESLTTDELKPADCDSAECGFRNNLRLKGSGWLAVVIDNEGRVTLVDLEANQSFFQGVIRPTIDGGLKDITPGGGALDCSTRECNGFEKGLAAVDFIPGIGKVIGVVGGVILVQAAKHADEVEELGEVILYRFGNSTETATRLGKKSQEAEDILGVHGVSTTTIKPKPNVKCSSANCSDVQQFFDVKQTGKNPSHHTVILPKPVTKETADTFNKLFGRDKK